VTEASIRLTELEYALPKEEKGEKLELEGE
jgi:hypothetical protein